MIRFIRHRKANNSFKFKNRYSFIPYDDETFSQVFEIVPVQNRILVKVDLEFFRRFDLNNHSEDFSRIINQKLIDCTSNNAGRPA